jgi:hypothetical protein
MIRVVHPGSRIRMLTFYPSRIPDPGVKEDPDPQQCPEPNHFAASGFALNSSFFGPLLGTSNFDAQMSGIKI